MKIRGHTTGDAETIVPPMPAGPALTYRDGMTYLARVHPIASPPHIWINADSLAHPPDELLRYLGESLVKIALASRAGALNDQVREVVIEVSSS